MEKKIKLNKELVVKKATISKLQESQMANLKGGIGSGLAGTSCYAGTCLASCYYLTCKGPSGAL